MAVKANKKRVMITLPKAQAEWLEKFTKERDITISHYISWMLAKKAEEMIKILKIQNEKDYSEAELHEILEIIKKEWVD